MNKMCGQVILFTSIPLCHSANEPSATKNGVMGLWLLYSCPDLSSGMSHGDTISALEITHKRQARIEISTTNTLRKIEFPTRWHHLSQETNQ